MPTDQFFRSGVDEPGYRDIVKFPDTGNILFIGGHDMGHIGTCFFQDLAGIAEGLIAFVFLLSVFKRFYEKAQSHGRQARYPLQVTHLHLIPSTSPGFEHVSDVIDPDLVKVFTRADLLGKGEPCGNKGRKLDIIGGQAVFNAEVPGVPPHFRSLPGEHLML